MFLLLISAIFRECLYTTEGYGVNKACRACGTFYIFQITISVYDIKKKMKIIHVNITNNNNNNNKVY